MRILIMIAALGLSLAAQKPDPAQTALKAATDKETLDGDLKAAIGMYRKVATSHKANRPVASRALLHLAEAQEKLGEAEARKVYEQIIREYGDQQSAAMARTRLAALSKSGAMTARRLVAVPPEWSTGLPNPIWPDGRFMFVSVSENGTSNPALLDLTSARLQRIAKPPGTGYIDSGVVSADHTLVAFTPQPISGVLDLTIANIDGSNPRAIFRTSPAVSWLYPLGFTADKKSVVVSFNRSGQRGYNLGRIDVATGTLTVLKDFADSSLTQHSLSPDGGWIVYSAKRTPDASTLDIFTLSSEGSTQQVLVDHAANDTHPVWTADGKGVMFLTNRRGTVDLWHVPVIAGKPAGEERSIKPDMGSVELMGCNQNGSLIYRASSGSASLFHSTLDPSTGKFRPLQELKESYSGQKLWPRLSPDEKQLAYIRRPDHAPDKAIVGLRDLASGDEREIVVPNLRSIGWVIWMPDQRGLIVSGRNQSELRVNTLIDLQSGESKVLPQISRDTQGYAIGGGTPTVSPDGKTLYIPMYKGPNGAVFAYDIATGSMRKMHEAKNYFNNPALSPDGKYLAFMDARMPNDFKGRILSTADDSVRDLPPGVIVQGWSRDSKFVYVTSTPDSIREVGGRKTMTFFRMPIEGGPLTAISDPIDFALVDYSEQLLGQTAVFRRDQQRFELWLLDNVLTATK